MVSKKRLSFEEIKLEIISMFQEIIEEEKLTDVELKINLFNIKSNGYTTINHKSSKIIIGLNINKIRLDSKDDKQILFRAYNTLVHEIEHAKTLSKTKENDFYDYDHLTVLLEYMSIALPFILNSKPDKKIDVKFLLELKKYMTRNYDFSISEIKSDLEAYKRSYKKFENQLNEQEKARYSLIISILTTLDSNVEIMVDNKNNINKVFQTILLVGIKAIKQKPSLYGEYKILNKVFTEDGNLKDPYYLYSKLNDDNREMYNKLILELLVNTEAESYAEYFKDEEFKKYVEQLFSAATKSAIDFYEEMDDFELFIKRKSILKENLKFLKSKVMKINKLCEKYGLNIECDTILDYKYLR